MLDITATSNSADSRDIATKSVSFHRITFEAPYNSRIYFKRQASNSELGPAGVVCGLPMACGPKVRNMAKSYYLISDLHIGGDEALGPVLRSND